MDQRYVAAIKLLGSFTQNAPVRVTLEDGKPRDMYVSRTIRRSDYAFGSPESSRVTVTYGPGRYACEVTADMLVLGMAGIEAREAEKGEKDFQEMTEQRNLDEKRHMPEDPEI